jgi:hypothetical protein
MTKQFVVVYQQDRATSREDGKRVTEIETIQEIYIAEYIQEVWEHIHSTWDLIEGERTLITIHEQHSAVFTVKKTK